MSAAADPQGALGVIDGDTFVVDGMRIRLFAVDAPEADQLCGGDQIPVWECGAWVTQQVRERFDGQQAVCKGRELDRYGRLVATCRVAGADLGATLVQDGLVFAYRKYGWDYDLEEKAAVIAGRGLHAGSVQAPAAFRLAGRKAQSSGAAQSSAPEGCAIKGNISAKDVRIYHVPGQRWYAETRISVTKGERWFCSEAEAQQAGWRRAKQ
ncbi:thermonuclease family protein [Puniceibacterium sp. IMCC21224]|uniref:thermonuclease family protein n=1 Tax=Puniceibacterium sp. IMCC21224 TaxID=1618204 RepID=UPI00065D22B6|nr:thermonuclease family protein [Puniceibacterium sp. IMCC21224]KMK67795.1 micrococcal nuclease-like nuclease [Puniceibacterium sp. IMCC21224]